METYGLEKLGIINAGAVYRNLTPAQLVEQEREKLKTTESMLEALKARIEDLKQA